MRRALRHTGIVLTLTALTLAGCGDGGSEPTASASEGSANAGAPVAGKPVTRASQFTGTWFRRGDLSSDPLVGVEFAPDGETVTFAVAQPSGGVQEVTLPYTLLEGGRIRVTHPQFPGQSQVAALTVSGSTLSLEPETQSPIGMVAGSFDKLSGQSVAQRLQQRIVEINAERDALQKEITAFIQQPNLVLVPDGQRDARVAIHFPGQGAEPVAYQRVGEVVLARQVRLGASRDRSGAPTAVLQLGSVVGPPGAGDIQGESITFQPRGEGKSLTLASGAAALRNDASLHATLQRDYEAILKARREAIDRFHAQIGHFLFLQAEPTNPNAAPEQLAFLRIEGEDAYRVASLRANTVLMPANFTDTAAVHLADGEARLRTRTHEILPAPGAPDASGGFVVSTRNGAQRFTTLLRLSREELDARRAALATLVSRMTSEPLQLVGVFRKSERGYIRPIRFALTSADGKALAGTFHADAIAIEGPVTGDIQESVLGLVVRIAMPRVSAQIVPGGVFDEGGTFMLHLELDGDTPVLTGRSQPGDRNNSVTLAPPSSESLAKLREMFLAHLQSGGRFAWDRTGSTGGSDEALSLTLAADGPDGVTGTVGFRRDQTGAVSGRLSEADGLLALDLTVQPTPGATTRPVATGPMRVYIIPFEDRFQLSGHSTWDGTTRTRYVSYAPVAP